MDVRPYQPTHRTACLAVFDSLVPDLTAPHSRTHFEQFLDNPAGPYFVIEHEEQIVSCGGFHLLPGAATATLLWGMVRSESRKLGLGRFLLLYRIREIGKAGHAQIVRVETSAQSAPFFEKQGFRLATTGNGTVELIKKLTVCA